MSQNSTAFTPALLDFLLQKKWPWEVLGKSLTAFVQQQVDAVPLNQRRQGAIHPTAVLEGNDIVVEAGATVEAHSFVTGPCYLRAGSTVRHGAYVRGSVWAEPGSVIGHTTEAKGTLLLRGAKAAHFAYVGDSLLGIDTNLGAGTKLANLRFDAQEVLVSGRVQEPGKSEKTKYKVSTGLKKLGAILGNQAQMGCNSVANPGTILLPHSVVPPNRTALGVVTNT